MAQTTRLDRIYTADRDEICDIYNDWADTYDKDLIQAGYATPARVAEALARFEADRTQPVLDFACGTGLSGAALSAEGFTLIDGCDISEGMLERARARGVYRYLRLIGPEDAPAPEDALPRHIVACGAISPGAAPPEALDRLLALLAPGGLLVLSLNDHALADPAYLGRINDHLDCASVHLLMREEGAHIPAKDIGATIYVLQKA